MGKFRFLGRILGNENFVYWQGLVSSKTIFIKTSEKHVNERHFKSHQTELNRKVWKSFGLTRELMCRISWAAQLICHPHALWDTGAEKVSVFSAGDQSLRASARDGRVWPRQTASWKTQIICVPPNLLNFHEYLRETKINKHLAASATARQY